MTISKEQYNQEIQHPEKLRSCYNCAHLHEALSLWCGNAKAIKYRGTRMPGVVHCIFWAPDADALRQMNKNLTNEIEKGSYYTGILIVN